MAAYDNDAYLRSLDASSADITRQVQNALDEVARQRTVALGQTSRIPGAVTNLMNEGSGRLNQSLASIGATALPSVSQSFENTKQSYGRVQGLLNSGFKERQARQSASVQGLGDDLSSQLRERAAQYTSQRQAEDRARAFQAQEAARQRALQEEMMNRQIAAQEALAQQQINETNFFAAIADGVTPEEAAFFGIDATVPPQTYPYLESLSRYFGMKDRQNLGLDAR